MDANKINAITSSVGSEEKNAATLDHALHVAGLGWYNIKYCLVLALFLISAIIEPVGYSYTLPAAKCDLDMTDAQRGFLSSVPYIGVILTSFLWGYLVDTRGRKLTVIYSSLFTGGFAILSAFMPNFISFTICKFLSSLCIACPAAVPYTFIGEILPLKYRDTTLSITNAMQITGSALVPLFAWAILPLDFRVNFGAYDFVPWRLLAIIYGLTFVVSALLLSCGPESPKYLISQGKHDETLEVLRMMYSKNKGKSPDDYPVSDFDHSNDFKIDDKVVNCAEHIMVPQLYAYFGTLFGALERLTSFLLLLFVVLARMLLRYGAKNRIKWLRTDEFVKKENLGIFTSLKVQSLPLLKAPYIKWMALNSFIFFGLFATLNGLYIWLPDVLNRVLTGDGEGLTACEVIAQRLNQTADDTAVCDNSIDTITFLINSVANVSCAIIALAVSSFVKIIGKKRLLITVLILIGTFCMLINVVTQDVLFAIFLSSIPIAGLAIGPVNAYAVEIFPTNLRGMAVSLSMMVGRIGSVAGANVAGLLLNAACTATFYLFGGLLIVCGLSAFLLPNSKVVPFPRDATTTKL